MKEKSLKKLTGFRKNHSIQHCWSCMLEIWNKVLDEGGYICAMKNYMTHENLFNKQKAKSKS